MMDHKRVYARVFGKVQGVAFREYTRREAVRLGLSGWVRNLPDGTVEVMFEGPEEQTDAHLSWLTSGSPFAVVTRIESYEETLLGETGSFIIQ